MKHVSPIIEITNKCNMACKYCYAGHKQKDILDVKKLNEDFKEKIPLLLRFTDEVISYNKFTPSTKFFFHGGEPLLINIENWREILNYFREKNYPLIPHIQTNATLINNNFVDLFKEFNVKIGASLDGPASMNDQTRIFEDDKGSFSVIFKNFQKLKHAGIDFGCLVTLNRTNINNVNTIYTFFKENHINFNIRSIFETMYSVPKEFLITPQEYARAACELFDLWFNDSETKLFLIKDFVTLIAQFIKPIEGMGICTFGKNCAKYFIYFDLEGNVYPCATLHNEREFFYGNVQKQSLVNILDSPLVKRLQRRWEILSEGECKDCDFREWCYGGCGSRAYRYYGNYFKKDYFCETYKLILKHVYGRIKESLKNECD